jgi:protein involved in polysaccharide export with SLBB domain
MGLLGALVARLAASRPIGLLVTLWLLGLVVAGCGAAQGQRALPAAIENTTLGQSDEIELHVVGEDKLPTKFTVASDGTVDVPYIHRLKVEGLEPQEVAELIRQKLLEKGFLLDASVSVAVTQYRSKRVEIAGEVQKPSSIPLEPGMGLLRAVSLAGGFTPLANKDRITIRRKTKTGVVVASVSYSAIQANEAPDIPLQAGDSINVEQRVF